MIVIKKHAYVFFFGFQEELVLSDTVTFLKDEQFPA